MSDLWSAIQQHDNAIVALFGIFITGIGSTIAWVVGRRMERRQVGMLAEQIQLDGFRLLVQTYQKTITQQDALIKSLQTRMIACEEDRQRLWLEIHRLKNG